MTKQSGIGRIIPDVFGKEVRKRKLKKGTILFLMAIFIPFNFVSGFQRQKELFPQEKHEVEVRLVLVDVIVTRDGKFVKDLTKDDFEIYEDGEKVAINSFELISFAEGELKFQEERPPLHPKKKLAVLFDGINSWEKELKKGIDRIIAELVSLVKLGHEVMILHLREGKELEIIQPFTTDEELIRKAVSRASASVWQAGQDLASLGLFDGLSEDRAYLIITAQLREYLLILRRKFEATLAGILATANMIKNLPGRKYILFISSGLPDISSTRTVNVGIDRVNMPSARAITVSVSPFQVFGKVRVFDPFNILEKKNFDSGDKAIREIIHFANSQNISIYSLDPDAFSRSLFSGDTAEYVTEDDASLSSKLSNEKLWKLQNLRWLSEDTGAITLRGGKKYQKFRQAMMTDLNYYYQLSFYPKRKQADDKYHEIKVRTKRSGLDLRFRKGYTDYSPDEVNKMFLVSAFYNPALFKRLSFEAELIPFHSDSGKYESWVNLSLPTKEFFLERSIDYAPKTLSLYIWIKDKKSEDKGSEILIKIPLDMTSSFLDYLKTVDYLPLHFKGQETDFSRKEYQVVFALYDPQTKEVGIGNSSFSLPDFEKEKEGIINCVLGTISFNPDQGKKSFSLSREDGGLEFNEIKFFPRVNRQFLPQENASVFIQIYLPKGKISVHPEFKISGKDIPAKLLAESWNERTKVWSGILRLDLNPVESGENSLKIEIPISKKESLTSQELKLGKLSK